QDEDDDAFERGHPAAAGLRILRLRGQPRRRSRLTWTERLDGQAHGEDRARTGITVAGGDGALVQLTHLAGDGHAQPPLALATPGLALRLSKPLEHVGQERGRDAQPRVL